MAILPLPLPPTPRCKSSHAKPLPLPLPQRNGYPYVLWTRDIPPTTAMVNSYGAWPFVMVLESGACRAGSCVSLWGVAARSTGNVARRPARGCLFEHAVLPGHAFDVGSIQLTRAHPTCLLQTARPGARCC